MNEEREAAALVFLERQATKESFRQREYHAKCWLNKVYEVTQKELAAKEEVMHRLEGMITNGAIDYAKDRVQSSETAGQEKRTIAFIEAAEAVDKTKEKIAGLISERMDVIDKMNGSNHRAVLIHRYVNMCKWPEIAEKMSYSVRQAQRIHDEAIKKITPIVEEYLVSKGDER